MLNVGSSDRFFDRSLALRALLALLWMSAALFISIPASATTTNTLDFQGFLKDSGGNVVDGPVTLTFRIFNAAQGGTMFWTDTISTTAVSGAFFVNLGGNPQDPLPIAQLSNWPDLYLEVEVSGDGQPMVPRFEMTGAVSAFYAQTAGDVPNKIIHPAQVVVASTGAAALQVNGVDVIDSTGKYVGPTVAGANGASGASGASGVTGPTGAGASGATGVSGATGATGANGPAGTAGNPGVSGSTGDTGLSGASGATGATGAGATGATGASGANGSNGVSGSSGATGGTGAAGTTGLSGATGATGAGNTGATGASGLNGSSGATGASGLNGSSGATGATGIGTSGATGATGANGQNGSSGATGATGTGTSGATGATGTGTSGATGATGTGSSGATGATGIGASGTTGATGAGVSGASGETGQTGVSGASGATGATGAGASGASGATGATGSSGATGASGASGATGDTGLSGASGATGATGVATTGSTGATGPSCIGGICSAAGPFQTVFNGQALGNSGPSGGLIQIAGAGPPAGNTLLGITANDGANYAFRVTDQGDATVAGELGVTGAIRSGGTIYTGTIQNQSGSLDLRTGNFSRLLIDSSGYVETANPVYIGSESTPSSMLEVAGTVTVDNGTLYSSVADGGNAFVLTPAAASPAYSTAGSKLLVVRNGTGGASKFTVDKDGGVTAASGFVIGTTPSNAPNGAFIGENAPVAFTGDLLHLESNGVTEAAITSTGVVTFPSGSAKIGIGNTSPGATLDIGTSGSNEGTMHLEGSGGGYVGIEAPTSAFTAWTLTLPTSPGASGYVLKTDGTGITSWATLSSLGAVTSVSASAPLSSSAGTTPNISISQATGAADGYLSSGDWTTFNGKVDGKGNLTTTGAVPYVSASGVLNQDATNLFWDSSNHRLGIGTSVPKAPLHLATSEASTANYGTLSVGSSPFDGTSANHFAGSVSGTVIAANSSPTFSGNLMDLQVGGTSNFVVGATGFVHANGITSPGIGASSEAFGNGATALGIGATALGPSASATNSNAVSIGEGALASGVNSTAIGPAAKTTANYSIAIGNSSTTTAMNQFVAGGVGAAVITDIYFGNGISYSTPSAFTIHGTSGSGSDVTGGDVAIAGGQGTGAGNGGSIIFRTSPAGASGATPNALNTQMVISPAGYVGIGTNSPTAPLDIETTDSTSSSNGRVAKINPTFSGATPVGPGAMEISPTFSVSGAVGTVYGLIARNEVNPTASGAITTSYAGYFRNDAGSATGGTLTNGVDIEASAPVFSGVPVTNQYGVEIGNQGNASVTTSVGLYVKNQTGASNSYAAIFAGGNVGIGTMSPAKVLDVVGDIRTSGCLYYASSSLGTCASDKRLKKDVKDYSLGLDALKGLQPVTFEYNGLGGLQDDGKIQIGLIAQMVEKVAPSLVKRQRVKLHAYDKELTEIKAVDYSALTYLLINSVKELYAKVMHHDTEIARLTAQNTRIEQENTELRSMLQSRAPASSVGSQDVQKLKQRADKAEQESSAIRAYLCAKDPSAPICK